MAVAGSSDLVARGAALQSSALVEAQPVDVKAVAVRTAPVARRSVAPRRNPAQQPRTAVIAAAPKRSWQKTALVIGGSTAAGAGVGAIADGKKGALIGAAIGGGAGAIFEAIKRKD